MAAPTVGVDDLAGKWECFKYRVLNNAGGKQQVLAIAGSLKERGIIRKFGAIARHQLAGYRHNLMVVWAVPPAECAAVGNRLAAFPEITKIPYEGPQSKNPLAFRWYDKDRLVLGKLVPWGALGVYGIAATLAEAVDPWALLEGELGADVVPAIADAISLQIHLVGDVEVGLTILDRAGPLVRAVPLTKLGERLHRGLGAE